MATNFEISRKSPSKMTLPVHPSAATLDSQSSQRANEANPTVQSKVMVLYCDVCERHFVNETGMRMHLTTSKDHKERVKRLTSNKTLSLNSAAVIQDPQPSGHGNMVNSTIQQAKVAVTSNEIILYCNVCEREFVNENAMRMHLATSKDHKIRVKRQKLLTHVQDLKPAASLTPGTFASSILYGHLAHTQNTLAAPAYGFTEVGDNALQYPEMMATSSVYGRASNAMTLSSHTSTKLQSQAQKKGASPHIATCMPQADRVPKSVFPAQANSSGQRIDLKHKNLVPTVIPSCQQLVELESLSEHCHTSEDLLKHKYLLCLYTADDIAGLCRCQNCQGLQRNIKTRLRPNCLFHSKKLRTQKDGQKLYPCCGEKGPGCISLPAHVYGKPDPILEASYREFALTPAPSSQLPKHRAVTLDCEMAGVAGGMSELILLCVADYLTGETLIDSLVSPTKKVVDWRSQVSGVTLTKMAVAEARRRTLKGWQEARNELWRYIDSDTILVGQSLHHDLDVLRIIHTNVVDSAILTANALGPGTNRVWGLKSLCDELLGIEIQNKGRQGHDCLEDALAAREVVLWCCRHPQELENWGKVKREEEEKKMEERRKAQEERNREKEKKKEEEKEKEKEKETEKKPPFKSSRSNTRDESIGDISNDEIEVLHWSDIAGDMGWPQ